MFEKDTKAAMKLAAVVEEFRKIDPEMQAQTMMVFLLVVSKPDIPMKDLEKLSGLSGAGISRNVAALGAVHRRGQPGHMLLEAYEDAADRRYKRVRPTAKGMRVFNSLASILGG